jgi:hypothetical protein
LIEKHLLNVACIEILCSRSLIGGSGFKSDGSLLKLWAEQFLHTGCQQKWKGVNGKYSVSQRLPRIIVCIGRHIIIRIDIVSGLQQNNTARISYTITI